MINIIYIYVRIRIHIYMNLYYLDLLLLYGIFNDESYDEIYAFPVFSLYKLPLNFSK